MCLIISSSIYTPLGWQHVELTLTTGHLKEYCTSQRQLCEYRAIVVTFRSWWRTKTRQFHLIVYGRNWSCIVQTCLSCMLARLTVISRKIMICQWPWLVVHTLRELAHMALGFETCLFNEPDISGAGLNTLLGGSGSFSTVGPGKGSYIHSSTWMSSIDICGLRMPKPITMHRTTMVCSVSVEQFSTMWCMTDLYVAQPFDVNMIFCVLVETTRWGSNHSVSQILGSIWRSAWAQCVCIGECSFGMQVILGLKVVLQPSGAQSI